MFVAFGAVLAASIGGCAATPAPAPLPPSVLRFDDPELRTRFAAARAFLDGIDPVETGAAWRAGDRILLGIALE